MAVSSPSHTEVGELIASDALRVVYQPIVDLASEATVGFEALARGPGGSPLEMPRELFAAAAREGLLPALDRACRMRALEGAGSARLDPASLLFVNVEPAGLDSGGVLDRRGELELERISVVVELTERALAARPSEVLAAVRWLRQRGCRIALDDVGVDRRSLALMPFLSPDVIKLDARLTQGQMPALDAARVLNAVGAEVERSGAVVLAEGIETPEHLRRARAMGAVLGQGWLFGRPGPLPVDHGDGAPWVPQRSVEDPPAGTPFEHIADARHLRRGDKSLLLALSRQLEQEAMGLQGEVVLVATFQEADFFTDLTRRRYETLARQAALVGAIGRGMDQRPGAGVRGADLAQDDALRDEWDVVVISPHFAGAFVARDLGDRGPDPQRRFDYFVTYDRGLVTDAASWLLRRIIPAF